MNLAQHEWEQNRVSRVRELLEETANAPERGFEWFYWQRQLHLELQALRGHTGPILAVAYSPDGWRIVTGSADHSARVWEADTGKELLTLSGEARAAVRRGLSSARHARILDPNGVSSGPRPGKCLR